MKSVVAMIVTSGLMVAFTAPAFASSNKAGELYNAARSKTECENLPNGQWDDKTKTCRNNRSFEGR
jgi:hypothetical protein